MSNVFVTIEHDAVVGVEKLEAFIKELIAKIESHGHKATVATTPAPVAPEVAPVVPPAA